jgi:hypothetical protein
MRPKDKTANKISNQTPLSAAYAMRQFHMSSPHSMPLASQVELSFSMTNVLRKYPKIRIRGHSIRAKLFIFF